MKYELAELIDRLRQFDTAHVPNTAWDSEIVEAIRMAFRSMGMEMPDDLLVSEDNG